jgi:hypothetical protein
MQQLVAAQMHFSRLWRPPTQGDDGLPLSLVTTTAGSRTSCNFQNNVAMRQLPAPSRREI